MCDQTTNTTGQIKADKVKAYAVTTPERVEALPDLPTTAEAGLEGVEIGVWHGVYVPAETPDDVVAKITDALAAALTDQAVVAKLAELGAPPAPAADVTPEAHRQKLQEQIDLWAPIIKESGVTAGG
jgi:tripartite-type tricarboxylate transporter receptor subunit TctC